MQAHELDKAIDTCFSVLPKDLKTDADISAFLEQEQVKRDPLNTLQYKVFISQNHSESESLLILKSHHCMCDGIATLVMTSSFAREPYTSDRFPRIVPNLSFG